MITVKILKGDRKKTVRYKENLKVEDLLKKFGYSYETAVVKRNKRINTEEEIIDDNDKITIIPIVSGG